MKTKFVTMLTLTVLLTVSCEKDTYNKTETGFRHGALITNEGGFGNSNGSVSYLDLDSAKIHNNLFSNVNGRPLGDVVQSVAVHGNRAYIVVNNSQKIEVVDIENFHSTGVIQGFSYPRYFLGIDDDRALVTNGALAGLVYVVDLNSLTVVDSIQVGFGPERMLMTEGLVFVANSGGWGLDSTLSVIDTGSMTVVHTIIAGYNPISMALDKNNQLWVLCKGKTVWGEDWTITEETVSELVKIDPASFQVTGRISIGSTGDYFWPGFMAADFSGGKILFPEAGGLYLIETDAATPEPALLIGRDFYGLGVDPVKGLIYGLSASSFTENGYIFRYEQDGSLIDSLGAGIAPNNIVFN